jgi:DNA-binding NarL/FixJ family response regulator
MNGLSMKEVATAMGLSVKTVQAHRTYACKRLNISGENNAKMTLTMLGLGLAHYSVENDVAVFVETKNS